MTEFADRPESKTETTDIDEIIRRSLRNFFHDILDQRWWGKEREAVNLYAFGHLLTCCRSRSVLEYPAQIGIEVRVPRPKYFGSKREVCKDLVIWPKPAMTCWNQQRKATNYPLAVMEWKVNERGISAYDLKWLRAFTGTWPQSTGYAVGLELEADNSRLQCVRISNSRADKEWLVIKETVQKSHVVPG
jgi:hypothetical protein